MLARVGINGEAISERLYSIVLTMAVMTSALTPFAARVVPVLYARWRGRFPREDMQTFNLPEAGLKDPVIGRAAIGKATPRTEAGRSALAETGGVSAFSILPLALLLGSGILAFRLMRRS